MCSAATEPLSSNWYFPTHGFVWEALRLFRNSVLLIIILVIVESADNSFVCELIMIFAHIILPCWFVIADEMERERPV